MGKTIEQIQGMNIPVGALINVKAEGKDIYGDYTGKLDSYAGYYIGVREMYSNLLITHSKSLAYELSEGMTASSFVLVQEISTKGINEIKIIDEEKE
jgi:hypothetical protein